jgi:L-fuculose-phosphate aldolase
MTKAERALRAEIIARCREMNAAGINQGTSGNISARFEGRMLITPSGIPYDDLEPEMIAALPLGGAGEGVWQGVHKPSSEWRFHFKLLSARPEAEGVIHTHPPYCTALALARMEIPACHYMVAAFGGNSVRCAGYATFGSEALADLALVAMAGRSACLLANHGMIVLGESLAKAMWRAVELEALARQYLLSLQAGGPVLLSDAEIEETLARFADYGVRGED